MQIIEAQQKNGSGSFTEWGLRQSCVQWQNRNSEPDKNLDTIKYYLDKTDAVVLLNSMQSKFSSKPTVCFPHAPHHSQ